MSIFDRVAARIDRQSNLMGGMMKRLDVDAGSVATLGLGLQLAQAARACAACGHSEACESWQVAHPEGADQAPEFCPNGALWAASRQL